GNLIDFGNRPDALHIDSEREPAGHCEQGQTVRVREVEVESSAVKGSSQSRLAPRFAGEGEPRRFDVQVTAKNHPQQSMTDDEPFPIAVELKPFSALAFAGGKSFGKRWQIGSQLVQPGAPGMNFIARQFRPSGRKRP